MKSNLLGRLFFITGTALLLSLTSFGQAHPSHNGEKAFDGNDIISYFNGEIKKGSDEYTYEYNDVKLYFASNESRELFKKAPEKYFPAYNGWCAIALAAGTLAKPDYNNYIIQDGKLLFFEVRAFFNGRTAWEKDPQINKITADAKYDELFKKDDN